MQLQASAFAAFLNRWDFHQVALSQDGLVLTGRDQNQIPLPFRQWSGAFRLKRELCWSRLTLDGVVNAQGEAVAPVALFGLPWLEAQQFVQRLAQQFESWRQHMDVQLKAFIFQANEALSQSVAQRQSLMRDSELHQLQQRLEQLMAEHQLTLPLLHAQYATQVSHLLPWLEQGKATQRKLNDALQPQLIARWQPWFAQSSAHPLNDSQQRAILEHNDATLILAGAGSGKTHVLTLKAAWLVAAKLAKAEQICLLAFGRDAKTQMADKLSSMGLGAIKVKTFHSLAFELVSQNQTITISPLADKASARKAWLATQLADLWQQSAHLRRWQKLVQEVPGLKGDKPLAEQVNQKKLQQWCWQQIDLLSQMGLNKKSLTMQLQAQQPSTGLAAAEILALIWPLYSRYLQALTETNSLDYAQLIRVASELMDKGKIQCPWHYLLVDEYQDISALRQQFLQHLRQACPQKMATALIAVGDDWQAIYGFTGAQIKLTTEFKSLHAGAVLRYLDTTYRFSQNLGQVANDFVLQNPYQQYKPLNSLTQGDGAAVTLAPQAQLGPLLMKLSQTHHQAPVSVLILARQHHQLAGLNFEPKALPGVQLSTMTVHASKGQEADFVIVLGMDQGLFPVELRTDWSVQLQQCLMPIEDDFMDSEERRLFYVALTRARRHVWLLSGATPSRFVLELRHEAGVENKLRALP